MLIREIADRRSIRRYRRDPVAREVLERLVDSARLAPTGANCQPFKFLVVDEKERLKRLFPALAWAGYLGEAGPPPEGQRPVAAILVLVDQDIRDTGYMWGAGAAVENILLQAVHEGLGACWLRAVDWDAARAALEIPERFVLDSVVALGYPAEFSIAEEETGSIKYYRASDGTLRVPKRRLSDVMRFNKPDW